MTPTRLDASDPFQSIRKACLLPGRTSGKSYSLTPVEESGEPITGDRRRRRRPPGRAPWRVGEVDLAVVAPVGSAEGGDGVLHHGADDSAASGNDPHGDTATGGGEESDELAVRRKERGKGAPGVGEVAGIRLVELPHPEPGVHPLAADEHHPPAVGGAIASRMLPIERIEVLSPSSSVARTMSLAPREGGASRRPIRRRRPAAGAPHRLRSANPDGRRPGPAERAAGPPWSVGLVSAAANSAAVANRSAGSFSSAVSTASSTVGRHALRWRRSGRGSSVITLATIACAVGPVNGGSPTSIS